MFISVIVCVCVYVCEGSTIHLTESHTTGTLGLEDIHLT